MEKVSLILYANQISAEMHNLTGQKMPQKTTRDGKIFLPNESENCPICGKTVELATLVG